MIVNFTEDSGGSPFFLERKFLFLGKGKSWNMKIIKLISAAILIISLSGQLIGQSYAFGFKGGPSLNNQTWTTSGERALLLAYFGDIYIESASSEKYGFGASLGYHIRGSNQKFGGGFGINGKYLGSVRYPSRLGNVSLLAYMKQYFPIKGSHNRYYYFFGGRLDYNVMKDLGRYSIFAPLVKDFTYGITAGGGFDWAFGELWGGFVELSFAPDFGKQIYIPQSTGLANPETGERVTISEGAVFNYSIELAVGLRLMHIITYIDG